MGEPTATYATPRADKPHGFPPVCSVWGAADHILPLSAGRALKDALRPDEAHVLDGAGHMLPIERPEPLSTIIETFLLHHATK